MTRFTPENLSARQEAIVSSALWAAAGDAIGWITELADERAVHNRTGGNAVKQTVSWKRRIGGRYGPSVDLPSGTYSDDTQLRLSVSRSIQLNGAFDPETFAKVELPVWLSYSLGAGRGTTAAASNLSKSSVSWFSNFFSGKSGSGYFSGGGNGAAMRVQPHVWNAFGKQRSNYEHDVLRDAIITHGHAQGFAGALFHAMCLEFALLNGELPQPDDWRDILNRLIGIADIVESDDKLSLFWLPAWEEQAGCSLRDQLDNVIRDAWRRLDQIGFMSGTMPEDYISAVSGLGGFAPETRGAGLLSAMSASALCWVSRHRTHEEALVLGANTLGSDTDTICSMAGAILGAARPVSLDWQVQDREYIVAEAIRIGSNDQNDLRHNYPDLMAWVPPSTQIDAVQLHQGQAFLSGLGPLEEISAPVSTSDAIWQWCRLPFGQTVLVKRRHDLRSLAEGSLPIQSLRRNSAHDRKQPELFNSRVTERELSSSVAEVDDIDTLSDSLIKNGLVAGEIGNAIIRIAKGPQGVERSVALAAILSKAIATRYRRRA